MSKVTKQNKNVFKNIGLRIRYLRKIKGVSQADLASLCNFENSNMYRIEAGKTNPTILTLYKVCIALDISLKELFDFELETLT